MKKIFWIIAFIILTHLLFIITYGFVSKAQKSDMIIILGNKVETTGIPSTRLKYRLDKGVELFKNGMADKIIVSGGIGKEGFDEAEVMANYLIAQGIDSLKIIKDNQGVTTFASAMNCVPILANERANSIIIVSQYFHLLRSQIAFKRVGIEIVSAEASDYFFEWRDFYSVLREVIGMYYYLLRSYE